jgi:Concanavalin A-like lectin/glucanases superfamily/Secretion system C-terminal sorting domain
MSQRNKSYLILEVMKLIKKVIYTLIVFLFTLLPLQIYGQTGLGGVGNTSGTSTLSAWYNANAGIATSGTVVTQWSDQSGYNNHLTPPATTNRPVWTSNAVNSYPIVTLDGIDDYLTAPSASSLNLTRWSIFIVGRINTHKSYNSIVEKGFDSQENYEFLSNYPGTGDIHFPVLFTDATRGINSGGTFSNTAYGVYQLDYNQTNFQVYINGSNVSTSAQTKIPQTNSRSLFIGNEEGTTGRNYSGTLAEIAIYSSTVNSAQRLIIHNYLSAKYGFTLASNDIYLQDNLGFFYNVAGIGRVDASNIHDDAQGTGIVRILNPANLDNDEFLIWGHDNGVQRGIEKTDIPAGIQARFQRVWRVNEVSTSGSAVDVGAIDIRWDLSGLGPVTTSDLRLLVDMNNNGIFSDEAPLGSATSLGGNIYAFTGITAISNNLRFTLATINATQTALPIDLISFKASVQNDKVKLDWQTAKEINNDYFTVEYSQNAGDWKVLKKIKGAGTSYDVLNYTTMDDYPANGISYYRLKQTDVNGEFTYSNIVSVNLDRQPSLKIAIYPNPAIDIILVNGDDISELTVLDALGRDLTTSCSFAFESKNQVKIDLSALSEGLYYIKTLTTLNKVVKDLSLHKLNLNNLGVIKNRRCKQKLRISSSFKKSKSYNP